jgi:hypothetical protein
MTTNFVFAGYLVQEPYLTKWPRREGMQVATVERDLYPEFKREWEQVGGVLNTTEFHVALPKKPEGSWVINGYGVERGAIERVHWSKAAGGSAPKTFEYALHLHRTKDGLTLLGYELVDCNIERLSVLNNCGYTLDEIRREAGDLNEFALFSDPQQAQAFQTYVAKRGGSHSESAIFEVLGERL